MKKMVSLSLGVLAAGLVLAQDMGRVISASPVLGQVSVPSQVCHTEQVALPAPKSGAGAVLGAIAGGALGSVVGGGSGQAAATMIGIMGGAIMGDRVENSPSEQSQKVQRCVTQNFYENRTIAYNVVYEFAGKQYNVQMPNDPGPTIALQVSPLGANTQPPSDPSTVAQPQSVVVQAPTVIMERTVYPTYYPYHPYYPTFGISLGLGYPVYSGHRPPHHRNFHPRHWR